MVKVAIGIGLAVACAVLARPSSAWGADAGGHVSLRWNAPDDCPDDAELVHGVEAYLGQTLAETRQEKLAISAAVSGSNGGYLAKIRFTSPSGIEERELEHPECRKLMDATALVVALAIDPERVKAWQQAREEAREPAAATEPAPAAPLPTEPQPLSLQLTSVPPRDQAEPPAPAESAARSPRLDLGLFAFAGGGVLPSVGPGIGADFSVGHGHFEAGVVGRYWLPRAVSVPRSQSADIELSLVSLGARACGLPWLGVWALRGCLGGMAGDLSGTGRGLANSHTRHALLPALSADLSLSYGRGQLLPFVGVEGTWALGRPAFGVSLNTGDVEVFRPRHGSLSGLVGLICLL